MTIYASTSPTPPFVTLQEIKYPGAAPEPLAFAPPLASVVTSYRTNELSDHLAFVYNYRRDLVPGIGSVGETIPTAGVRVFSPRSTYAIFGGDAGSAPKAYERRGPGYNISTAFPLPASGFIARVAFSEDERWMALVASGAPTDVELYFIDASGFTLVGLVPSPSAETPTVRFPGTRDLMILSTTTAYSLTTLGGTIGTMTNPQTGTLLAINGLGNLYIFDTGTSTDNLIAYSYAKGTGFTLIGELPSSQGSGRRAFCPLDSQRVIVTIGGAAKTYALDAGSFVFAGEVALDSASVTTASFSRNSEYLALGTVGTGAKAHILRRQVVETPFAEFLPSAFAVGVSARRITATPGATHLVIADLAGNTPPAKVLKRSGDAFTEIASTLGAVGSGESCHFDPTGTYLAITRLSAPYLHLFKRNGDTFTALTNPATMPTSGAYGGVFSPDGVHLIVTQTSGERVLIYKRDGDTFTKLPALANPPEATPQRITFSKDGQFVFMSNTGYGIAIYSRSGDTFTRVTQPAGIPTNAIREISVSRDDNHIAIAYNVAPQLVIMKRSGSTFSVLPSPSVMPDAVVGTLTFAPHEDRLVVGMGTTNRIYSYHIEGDSFTAQPDLANPISTVHLVYSDTGDILLAATWQTFDTTRAYRSLEVTSQVKYEAFGEVTGAFKAIEFAPDGTLIHLTSTTDVGTHLDFPALTARTPLPFTDLTPTTGVFNVRYTPDGSGVFWQTSNGIELGWKDARSGNYFDAIEMNGTFVAVYERSGETFIEKGFAFHGEDVEITNLVFSRSALAFSYFLLDPTRTEVGRYLYQTDEGMVFRGRETDAEMDRSYLAFAPSEAFFVATYRNLNNEPYIKAYVFDEMMGYDETDVEPVPFGPVSISGCRDVIVAHGGLAKPFTLFKYFDGILTERPYFINGWDYAGVIFDIIFDDDCRTIIILTPDEIIVADADPDDEEEEIDIEVTDRETHPTIPESQLEPGPDDGISVNHPGYNGGGNVNTGTFIPIVPPIPYSTIAVTYHRQRSPQW